MKRVSLIVSALMFFACAQSKADESYDCSSEHRKNIMDGYAEWSDKSESYKKDEERCRNNYIIKGMNTPPGNCNYGALIAQANKFKLEWKFKMQDFDRSCK